MPFPAFDGKNVDFSPVEEDPDEDTATKSNDERVGPGFAPCITPSDFSSEFGGKRSPNLFADP